MEVYVIDFGTLFDLLNSGVRYAALCPVNSIAYNTASNAGRAASRPSNGFERVKRMICLKETLAAQTIQKAAKPLEATWA